MKLAYTIAVTAILGLGTSAAYLHAADAADQTANTTKTEKKTRATRLPAPYSKLDNLTDDQKTKIAAIHKDMLAEMRKLEMKQDDDIKAVLTDDQKTQLVTLKEEMSAKHKTANKATTQPAD